MLHVSMIEAEVGPLQFEKHIPPKRVYRKVTTNKIISVTNLPMRHAVEYSL
jgi:hypothetical protein